MIAKKQWEDNDLLVWRSQKTKEQWLSEFDKIIIDCWYDVTGVELKLRTIQERKDLDFLF